MTVPRAVLNISEKDFTSGITYVAISRLKSLDGILFEQPFDYERFQDKPSDTMRMRNEDYSRRSAEVALREEFEFRSSSPHGPTD